MGQAHVCADTWLTGAKIDAQSARQYHNTISCDQLMAEVTSQHTRFASLELSIASGTGQPNNSTTLAFSRDGVPLPAEDNPRTVFDRLFGEEPGGVAARRTSLHKRRSVLDAVLEDAKSLRRGAGHRRPRPSSTNICIRCATWSSAPSGSTPGSTCPSPRSTAAPFQRNVTKDQAGEYYRTMYDLIVLALRTDMTRVVTYMSGSEGNGLAIPEIGITQSRHQLSHHGGDPEMLGRLSKSDAFIMQQFAYFLDKLAGIAEEERTAARPDDGPVRQRHELRPQPLQLATCRSCWPAAADWG